MLTCMYTVLFVDHVEVVANVAMQMLTQLVNQGLQNIFKINNCTTVLCGTRMLFSVRMYIKFPSSLF